jgi:hypothetical protein
VRVAVDGGGFVAAGTAARTANQVAALHHDSLSGKLGGFGAMAGNDATSIEFARSYDEASAEALDALADLSAAFIGLGRLIQATDDNHRRAEAASAGVVVSAYSGRDLHEDDYVRVAGSTPPSSLGAQEPGFGEVETWILDRIEGFVWPGADVGRLRDAASTWRNAATGVDDLVGYCERASVELGRQISPEIPLALDAVEDLRASVRQLRDGFGELARMCDEYAASVETAHERTRALLAEIAQMIVEGLVLSAAVGLITGGTASGAVASATVARVLEAAPRFRALLVTLGDAASVCASRLRTAREGATVVRGRLEKFLRLDLRNERGAVSLPGITRSWERGWLRRHEVPPGHTLRLHVAKTVDELLELCVASNKRLASSFTSEAEAEGLVAKVVEAHAAEIREWLARGSRRALPLDADIGRVTGTTVTRAGDVISPTGVRVVLIPKPGTRDGWQLLTAFPN